MSTTRGTPGYLLETSLQPTIKWISKLNSIFLQFTCQILFEPRTLDTLADESSFKRCRDDKTFGAQLFIMALIEVFRNASDSLVHEINDNLFHIDVADELCKQSLITKATADLLKDFDAGDEIKTRTLISDIVAKTANAATTAGGEAISAKLYVSLQRTGYSHLITILKRYVDQFESMNELFSAGRVPSTPADFVDRPALISELRTAIAEHCELKRPGGSWVLVRGMAGTGKSVAVSAAIRDAAFAVKNFHCGVYWLSFSRLQKEFIDVEINKQLLLLYRYLNSVVSRSSVSDSNEPRDQEELLTRLRDLFAKHKYARDCLLVLDDVWDDAVVKAFAKIECKCTIVTTRQRRFVSILNSGTPCTIIQVDDGFTQEQSLNLFTAALGCKCDALPSEARLIHERCVGSPLAISLIASILKERADWQGVLNELCNSQLTALSRRQSGHVMTLTLAEQESTDPMSPSLPTSLLTRAISMSVDNLSPNDRTRFLAFAAFNDDVPIPCEALRIIWSLASREAVCQQMHAFVNSSLCHEEYSEKIGQSVYWLHDLILDFLKDLARQHSDDNDDLLIRYHCNIVEAYRRECNGDWYNLPYDFYAHRFLYWHMIEAGLYADVTNLYTNLCFLSRKIQRSGVESVLLDYSLIEKKFRSTTRRHRNSSNSRHSNNSKLSAAVLDQFKQLYDFERFFYNQKCLIHSSGANLLQVALLEPRGSVVYQAAVKSYEAVHGQKTHQQHEYLFKWLNQPQRLLRTNENTDMICIARIFTSHSLQCGVFLRRDPYAVVLADDRGVVQQFDINSLKRSSEKVKITAASISAMFANRNGDKLLIAADDGLVRLIKLPPSLSTLRSSQSFTSSATSVDGKPPRPERSSSQKRLRGAGNSTARDRDEYKLKLAHYLSVSDSEEDEEKIVRGDGAGEASSDGEQPASAGTSLMQYEGHKNVRVTAMAASISGKRYLTADVNGALHLWQDEKLLCSANLDLSQEKEEISSVSLGAYEEWAVTTSLVQSTSKATSSCYMMRFWQISTSAIAECSFLRTEINQPGGAAAKPYCIACRTPQYQNTFLAMTSAGCVEQFQAERNETMPADGGKKWLFSRNGRKFSVVADEKQHVTWPIVALCLTSDDRYLAVAVNHLVFLYNFASESFAKQQGGSAEILCMLRGPTDRITSLSFNSSHATSQQQQLLMATSRNGSAFVFNIGHCIGVKFDTPVRAAADIRAIVALPSSPANKQRENHMNEFILKGPCNSGGGIIYDSSSYDVCFIHHKCNDNSMIDNNDAATMPNGVLLLTSDCVKQDLHYVALTLYRFVENEDNVDDLAGGGEMFISSEPLIHNKLQAFLRLPQHVDVMKITPNARMLIFGLNDGTLRFVRLNDNVITTDKTNVGTSMVEKWVDIKHHEGRICTIQFHYGYAVTTGSDFSVRFWALDGGACGGGADWPPVHIMCFVAHSSPVVSLVLPQPSHSLVYIAAGGVGGENNIAIHQQQRFKILAAAQPPPGSTTPTTLGYPAAGDKFVSVGDDGVIKLCSLRMAHSLAAAGSLTSWSPATRTPSDHAWCMSNDAKYLLGCSGDGRAQIWDIEAALLAEQQSATTTAGKGLLGGALLDEEPMAVCQAFSTATTCGIFVPVARTRLNIVNTDNMIGRGDAGRDVTTNRRKSGSDVVGVEGSDVADGASTVRRSSLPTLAVDANASPDFFSSLVVLGSQDGQLAFWNWQRSEAPLSRHRVSSSSKTPIRQIAHFAIYEQHRPLGVSDDDDDDLIPINLILVLSDALYLYQVPEWVSSAAGGRESPDKTRRRDVKTGEDADGVESLIPLQVFPLLGRGARKFYVQSARKMIVVVDDIGYLYIIKPEF